MLPSLPSTPQSAANTQLSSPTHAVDTKQEPNSPHIYKVYRERWFALAMFSLLEMANALLWVTFSPISDVAQHYFGGESSFYGSTTGVNMMANIFLILFTPGTILAVLSMKYLKPRNSVIIAGVLTSIGALLRYLAVLFDNSLTHEQVYLLIFAGQSLAAIAQPMFLNFPPAMASIWFPVDERDISTTIGSMSSPVGNAIGSVIPVFFVFESQTGPGDDDSSYRVRGMGDLMLVEFLLCTVPLVFAVLYFRDAPPTPPSHSTQLKLQHEQHLHTHTHNDAHSTHTQSLHTVDTAFAAREQEREAQLLSEQHSPRNTNSTRYESFSHSHSTQSPLIREFSPDKDNAHHTDPHTAPTHHIHTHTVPHTQEGNEQWLSLKRDLLHLLRNKDYLILFCAFSIGVGFFNSIMTLLNQIVGPFGYSNDDAGTFGAVFIFCGLAGAGCMGHLMERTKAYRTLLKGGIVTCCAMVTLFVVMLFSNNFWPLTVSMGLMGFFILPLLPVMMENCAECTYPVPEELSMGILFTGCNVVGLAFIFILQYLLDLKPFGPPPFLPSNAFILGVLLLAACLLVLYHGEYKRLQHEAENTQLDDDEDGAGAEITTHNTEYDKEALTACDLTQPILAQHTHTEKQNQKKKNASPLPRVLTKGSDDVNLVRVASAEGSENSSNHSQLQGSVTMSIATNIWSLSRPTSVPLSRQNSVQ